MLLKPYWAKQVTRRAADRTMLLFMRKVLIFDPSSRLHSTAFEIGLQSSLWIRIRRIWMMTGKVFRIKSKNLIFETFRFSKSVMMFVMWLRIKA